MEEEFKVIFIGGESDGVILTTGDRPNLQPKTAKGQFYEFLLEITDSKTFFYFSPKDLSREEAMVKANN